MLLKFFRAMHLVALSRVFWWRTLNAIEPTKKMEVFILAGNMYDDGIELDKWWERILHGFQCVRFGILLENA